MRKSTVRVICWVLMIAMIGTSNVWAARRNKKEDKVQLTEQGEKLKAKFAGQLKILKAQIVNALPKIDEAKKKAYLEAREAEKAAVEAVSAAKKNFGKLKRARGLVGHAKGKWIGGAEKGIAKAKAQLKKAKTDAEREAARKELEKWQKNKQAGLDALKERQAMLDEALRQEPKWTKDLEEAEEVYAEAKENTMKAFDALGLNSFLASDELDARLAKYVVMSEAKPEGLAAYAQQGKEQEKLIEELLEDKNLLIQMAIADGASGGNYGKAMEIYQAIQQESKKAKDGVLQRLALAIALEHAVPVSQRNPKADTDAPKTVDPVNRYLHYEKAYLNGELDPAFEGLNTWDLRMVVNGQEPDKTLAWGRKMLRSYRPDHIRTKDYRWRYVALVRSDIRYGSQYNKFDKPELQFFQNILMNGGVCGRRAFIGRFILRAFGIPTTARPQRGHAALAHWTPDGWVVCLGGGWGSGWTKGRYNKDLDFLANTQARDVEEKYPQVKRAQWVGSVVGEKPVYGFKSGDPGFWYGVSLYKQRQIIEEAKAVALAAVGTDIGEANETKEKVEIENTDITEEDRKISVAKDGTITIPAAACSSPSKSTRKIIFMDSDLGGKQLHYSRTGGAQDFEYTFDAPKAGKYSLTSRIISPGWGQLLVVKSTAASEPVEIKVPLTVGLWGETEPVEIELQKGRNVLKFSRSGDNIRGLTIKDFTLKPM